MGNWKYIHDNIHNQILSLNNPYWVDVPLNKWTKTNQLFVRPLSKAKNTLTVSSAVDQSDDW